MINSSLKKVQSGRGFTLIELLIVIGVIAILAAIVIVAINPSRQFAQARNTQRESNVSTILNAIGQNMADNKGVFDPADDCDAITTTEENIGTDSANTDLTDCLVPTYISTAIPVDPGTDASGDPFDASDTGYTVERDAEGRITVCAPEHNETPIIEGSTAYCLTR